MGVRVEHVACADTGDLLATTLGFVLTRRRRQRLNKRLRLDVLEVH